MEHGSGLFGVGMILQFLLSLFLIHFWRAWGEPSVRDDEPLRDNRGRKGKRGLWRNR